MARADRRDRMRLRRLDWSIDLEMRAAASASARHCRATSIPSVLLASPSCPREVQKVLDSFGSGVGHVFNLGHGVPQSARRKMSRHWSLQCTNLSPKFHDRGGNRGLAGESQQMTYATNAAAKPLLARSFEHLPGEVCKSLTLRAFDEPAF